MVARITFSNLSGFYNYTLDVKFKTTHKPIKKPTNHPNYPQTTYKLAKPPLNQPNTKPITH